MKYILFWNEFYGSTAMNLGLGSSIFERCPIKNCYTTHDRTFMNEEDFDAIIFYSARWYASSNPAPDQNKRKSKQKYVFFSWESPYNSFFEEKYVENFYNWTLTYRRDSDIHFPYRTFIFKDTKYVPPTLDEFKTKTKTAMWLVSNCHTMGTERRKNYVNLLKKYIDIDVYGKCGTYSCDNSTACRIILEKNYYYYLAFENTQTQDYVTEKTYDNLMYNAIPVVLGNANYDDIVPPHSVIDVKDFGSPKILADFLIRLKNNYTEYVSYFTWKNKYTLLETSEYALCQLCEMLHRPLEYSSYDNIKDWFFGFNSYLKR